MSSRSVPHPAHVIESRATTNCRPTAGALGAQDPLVPPAQPDAQPAGDAEACDAMAGSARRRAARPSAATTVASREVAGCLAPNGPDHNAALHGDRAAVRDGLHHQPQPWHSGEDAKGQEQGQDAGRPEEGLKGPTWHRAAVASIQGLQGLTKRTLGVCSRRRSAETKGFERQLLVDVPSMLKSLATFGMGAGSTRSTLKRQEIFVVQPPPK